MARRHRILTKGKTSNFLSIALWIGLIVTSVRAQDWTSSEKLKALALPSLSGEVSVLYSEGSVQRAKILQDLAEAQSNYLQKPEILGIKLDLALAVLDSEAWAKVSPLPYGVAHIFPNPPTAVLPATEDNVLVQGTLKLKDNLSKKTFKRLDEIEIPFDKAVPMFYDLIGFHEIGHLYAFAYGVDTWPEDKWLCEFIATYLAYAFIKENRPKLASLWGIICDANVEGRTPEHITLADFEKLYIGVGNDNYGWYQGKFQQRVGEVYKKSGISFIHGLRKSLIKQPKASEGDPYRLKQLDAFSFGFSEWAKGTDGELKE